MKKEKIKIFTLYAYLTNQYLEFFSNKYEIVITEDSSEEDISIALFTGGEDVNPIYYDEQLGSNTYINAKRDTLEEEAFNSLAPHVLKVGICRGSQFLTVMSGGKLIQHITGHSRSHNVVDIENNIFEVTSTHHQMMYPFNLNKDNYDIIGISQDILSEKYLNGNDQEILLDKNFKECEIVYYKNTNSLAIQGHPEFNHSTLEFKNYCYNLIDKLL